MTICFRCGKCKRFLKLITAKPERLVCPICTDTYNVPGNGTVKTYKETQCPLDGFDLLYFSGSKSFIFCPNCYNNPPFEDMGKGSACIKCTNNSCQYSMSSNTVGACSACTYNGSLVLDQGSGPPSWKVYCSKCNFSMSLFKDASKVSVERDKCSHCRRRLIKLKYSESKTKLAHGLTEFKGCLWCSPELISIREAITNFSKSFSSNNQRDNAPGQIRYNQNGQNYNSSGRGRGRGRGRGTLRGGSHSRGRGGSSRGRGYSR